MSCLYFLKSFSKKVFSYVYSALMFIWIVFLSVLFVFVIIIFFIFAIFMGWDRFSVLARRALYLWSYGVLLFYSIETRGLSNINKDKAYIIFSNHQGKLDIPILTKLLDFPFVWFIKDELFSIPLFGWFLSKLSYIPVARGTSSLALSAFMRGVANLRKGISVAIFPEGTWSPYPNKILPFKQGLYYLARKTKVQLLPITIMGSHRANPPDSMQLNPAKIKIIVHSPVYIDGYAKKDANVFLADMKAIIEEPLQERV